MALKQTVIDALGLSEEELASRLSDNIREVFSTMVGMDGLLHLPGHAAPPMCFEDSITAMVGLTGTFSGLVCLHAPIDLALAFTAGMLGMEVTELDDDVRDAIGEIANMTAGSFKQHLSDGGADIKLSTPSVISGKEYHVSTGNAADAFTLHFSAEGQSFLISATLENNMHTA